MTPAMTMMTTAALDVNAIAQASALRIVDCLVEGTLIAVFAAVVLRLMRRQSSATRFAVWFAALVAIAALPLLGGGIFGHGVFCRETWPRGGDASGFMAALFAGGVGGDCGLVAGSSRARVVASACDSKELCAG